MTPGTPAEVRRRCQGRACSRTLERAHRGQVPAILFRPPGWVHAPLLLVLAVTAGSLLVASFVLGLMASGEPRGPHAIWHGVHILFALMTTMATLAVHSIVYTYFLATGKWAKEVVRVYQLPEWINTQAKKNKRKAFRFVMWSMTLDRHHGLARGGGRHARDEPALAPGHRRGDAGVQLRRVRRRVCRDRRAGPALMEVKDQADRLREARDGGRGSATAATDLSPSRKGESSLMSPLGVVVLIVLVDLLGFSS